MEKKIYKIWNKKTKLFAHRGEDKHDWGKQGHEWTRKNHLNCHITNCRGSGKYDKDYIIIVETYKIENVESFAMENFK